MRSGWTARSEQIHLSHHLYILAAMNLADTSVEPLDVAFMRRWVPIRIDAERRHSSLTSTSPTQMPRSLNSPRTPRTCTGRPSKRGRPSTSGSRSVVDGIPARARRPHGGRPAGEPRQPPSATYRVTWQRIRDHIDEVFFGDVRCSRSMPERHGRGPGPRIFARGDRVR